MPRARDASSGDRPSGLAPAGKEDRDVEIDAVGGREGRDLLKVLPAEPLPLFRRQLHDRAAEGAATDDLPPRVGVRQIVADLVRLDRYIRETGTVQEVGAERRVRQSLPGEG